MTLLVPLKCFLPLLPSCTPKKNLGVKLSQEMKFKKIKLKQSINILISDAQANFGATLLPQNTSWLVFRRIGNLIHLHLQVTTGHIFSLIWTNWTPNRQNSVAPKKVLLFKSHIKINYQPNVLSNPENIVSSPLLHTHWLMRVLRTVLYADKHLTSIIICAFDNKYIIFIETLEENSFTMIPFCLCQLPASTTRLLTPIK